MQYIYGQEKRKGGSYIDPREFRKQNPRASKLDYNRACVYASGNK